MFRQFGRLRRWFAIGLITLVVSLVFLATTDSVNIWPIRNILTYQVTNWLSDHETDRATPSSGEIVGCVHDEEGAPITAATVLLAEWDGTLHRDTTGDDGCYTITALPAGRYVPLAHASGFASASIRPWGLPLSIGPNERHTLNVTLPPVSLPNVQPGSDLRVSTPITVSGDVPQPATALRREISYTSGRQPSQPTRLYTPITDTLHLPTLLTVYPGPVDSWESVSIPLAAAGYAVVAVGPPYTLDFEGDIDELQRLVAFVRAGQLPGTDGQRIALLGGSYSSLHVFRLLQRDSGFRGALLLGPPTDLFELRRRFEAGSFFPAYGLDQALIALGTPNTNPERYWRYSAVYHVRRDQPPLALLHSRDDEIVPFQQSEILAAELERLGAPHETYFFDGLPHYLFATETSSRLTELFTITIDFLQRTMAEE